MLCSLMTVAAVEGTVESEMGIDLDWWTGKDLQGSDRGHFPGLSRRLPVERGKEWGPRLG